MDEEQSRPHGRRSAPPALGQHKDGAEIEGLPGLLLVARRQRSVDLAACVDVARERADRRGLPYAAAVLHRPGTDETGDIGASFVVQPLDQFLELLEGDRKVAG